MEAVRPQFDEKNCAGLSAQLDNWSDVNNKKVVFNRLGHLLLIVALLGATGSHWMMLQSVAWATMLAENARTDSFQTALANTFDGRHPCALCKQIAQGRQSEKKSDQQLTVKKLEFFNQPVVFIITSPARYALSGERNSSAVQLPHSPPVPPPRSLPG